MEDSSAAPAALVPDFQIVRLESGNKGRADIIGRREDGKVVIFREANPRAKVQLTDIRPDNRIPQFLACHPVEERASVIIAEAAFPLKKLLRMHEGPELLCVVAKGYSDARHKMVPKIQLALEQDQEAIRAEEEAELQKQLEAEQREAERRAAEDAKAEELRRQLGAFYAKFVFAELTPAEPETTRGYRLFHFARKDGDKAVTPAKEDFEELTSFFDIPVWAASSPVCPKWYAEDALPAQTVMIEEEFLENVL